MKKFTDLEGYNCLSCMGNGCCDEWMQGRTNPCGGKYYANKEETEVLLEWYNMISPPRLKFRVGDDVFSTNFGNGCVTQVDSSQTYPVLVKFECGKLESFLTNGKLKGFDEFRSLFFGHNLKVIVNEINPERMYTTVWVVMTIDVATNKIYHLSFVDYQDANEYYEFNDQHGSLPPINVNIKDKDDIKEILNQMLTNKTNK